MTLPKKPAAKLGPMSHIGIVVRDIDQAMEYYSSVFGLGPFDIQVHTLDPFVFRGKTSRARVKAALAYAGPVFIELVQVLEGETPHTEFLREHGEGVQHVAFLTRDIEGKLVELAKEGIKPLIDYHVPVDMPADPKDAKGGPRRMQLHEVYLDSGEIGGTTIQLMEFKEVSSG